MTVSAEADKRGRLESMSPESTVASRSSRGAASGRRNTNYPQSLRTCQGDEARRSRSHGFRLGQDVLGDRVALAGGQVAGKRGCFRWSIQVRRPAFLDSSKSPDRKRNNPGRDKHRNDHEPEQVDVDVLEPGPEDPGEAELRGGQTAELDRADDERHDNGKGGDREVVEDLAEGLEKGPAVSEVHE